MPFQMDSETPDGARLDARARRARAIIIVVMAVLIVARFAYLLVTRSGAPAMNKTLLPIRIVFVLLCTAAGWLVCYTITSGMPTASGPPSWVLHRRPRRPCGLVLKGFSLRGLSALTFGIAVGTIIAHLISTSPLFAEGNPEMIFLASRALPYLPYLGPSSPSGERTSSTSYTYVRFVPHEVDVLSWSWTRAFSLMGGLRAYARRAS